MLRLLLGTPEFPSACLHIIGAYMTVLFYIVWIVQYITGILRIFINNVRCSTDHIHTITSACSLFHSYAENDHLVLHIHSSILYLQLGAWYHQFWSADDVCISFDNLLMCRRKGCPPTIKANKRDPILL